MKNLNSVDDYLVTAKLAVIPEIISKSNDNYERIKKELSSIGILEDTELNNSFIRVLIVLDQDIEGYKAIEWLPYKPLQKFLDEIDSLGVNYPRLRYFDKNINKIIEIRFNKEILDDETNMKLFNFKYLFKSLNSLI